MKYSIVWLQGCAFKNLFNNLSINGSSKTRNISKNEISHTAPVSRIYADGWPSRLHDTFTRTPYIPLPPRNMNFYTSDL